MLFKATSFADFLDRLSLISEIQSADKRRLTELSDAAKEVADAKDFLTTQKGALSEKREKLKDSQKELEEKRAEADALLEDLLSRGDEFERYMADAEERQAKAMLELANARSDSIKVVVPGKTLNEVSKIISGGTDDEVRLYFTENHVLFEFDDTIVVSRLIEGEYFRIDQMLSSDYDTKISVNKKEFLNCIDRATLLVREGDKKPIVIEISDGKMELKIDSSMGSMDEEIDIEKEGKDILIGFNPKFLIDALKVIDDEVIHMYLMNPKAPCFIRDDEENYTYLILPVNISQNQNR